MIYNHESSSKLGIKHDSNHCFYQIIGGLDAGMDFELTFVMLPYTITEMSWFFDYSATTSEQLVSQD